YKAGGSTIIDGLKNQFGPDKVIELDKDATYAKDAYNIPFFEQLAGTHPETTAFTAHRVIPNIHFSTKLNVYPITFVRHPLLRAASVYRFERIRQDDWPRKHFAQKFDFPGWIRWCFDSDQEFESRNVQTRLLSLNDNGQFMVRLESNVYRGNVPIVYERLDS